VHGQPELLARAVSVPGDISSAAFPLAAAVLVPGAELVIENVGVNPLRVGLLETLEDMGAEIELAGRREVAGEPVADLVVRASRLRGVSVPGERAPRMIDEYPILAVLAACAEGRTEMHGLAELRVKESDRLIALADGLVACGVGVEISQDGLAIHGVGAPPPGGGAVESCHDHRIAMAFLVLGMVARAPVAIDDGAMIATSFPGFVALMNRLGGAIGDG
jgi:3-phosphoshikimate 1-carboxyvinyltransferase